MRTPWGTGGREPQPQLQPFPPHHHHHHQLHYQPQHHHLHHSLHHNYPPLINQKWILSHFFRTILLAVSGKFTCTFQQIHMQLWRNLNYVLETNFISFVLSYFSGFVCPICGTQPFFRCYTLVCIL